MSNHYALLIGIDHYFEYRLPGGTYYPKLGGCVRDITKVYNFLTARLHIPAQQIIKLTASLGGAQPKEDPSQWPTYTNMVNAFNTITETAQAGDQLYIQYSGHGGRTTTMFPAIKGEGEFDEGLVPLDIGKQDDPTARYLRDAEIYELLKRIVDKGIRLTVVFDCCHSGGATREIGGAVKRGLAGADLSPAPTDSLVAPLNELIAHWQGNGVGVTRQVKSQTDWQFETKGYTLFAACRANESAFEYPFDGRESNGALTYWLLDTLSNAGPNFTWKMVGDRVTAKVHSQFELQTPMVQGETDFRVFGHDRLITSYAVAVMAVEVAQQRLRLGAGAAHGISAGTQFAVYPVGTTNFNEQATRLALVTVAQVNEVDSWATITEGQATGIDIGAQAVMLNAADVKLQRDVRVEMEDATLRSQIEAALREHGRGFVTLAGTTDEFVIKVVDGEFVIADTTGAPLPNLRPALRTDDPTAARQLVERLVHLVQYRNVLALDMPDPTAQANLTVALQTPGDPIHPGDEVTLKITNTQSPNVRDPNDPQLVLNVAILALSSDWSISQIYPATAAFEPVDPGKSIDLTFEAYLPDGQSESNDIFKVFATRSTTDFHWLELPALDQPPLPRAIIREAITDPLEQLLASLTDETTQTRAFKLTKSPAASAGWSVDHVTLRVQAPTGVDSEIERRLRPKGYSDEGFLGYRERFETVVAQDTEQLAALGLTHGQIADTIQDLLERALAVEAKTDWNERSERKVDHEEFYTVWKGAEVPTTWLAALKGYTVAQYQVLLHGYRGYQTCPWDCRIDPSFACFDFVIVNRDSSLYFTGPALITHLIRDHQFFEGRQSFYRVDPLQATQVLNLI